MTFRRAAFFILISIFLLQPLMASDWPMSRKDANQRGAADDQLKLPLGLAWQYNTTKSLNNPSAPAVVNGIVYFASADRVYAIDGQNGELKWKYPEEQSLPNVVRSSPAVVDGSVYFGCSDGNLYSINAEDGSYQWAFATGSAIRSSPIVSGDTIFVGSDDDYLYAINASTGESIWGSSGFRTRGDIPHAPAANNGIVTFASMDLHIYGAAESTGKYLWGYRLVSAAAKSSPVIVDNTVYIGAGSVVYGLSLRSGLQKLGITLPSEVSGTPAVSERDIYIVCKNKKLYAYTISGRTTKPKWPEPADLTFTPTSGATIAGDTIFVAGGKGVVAAFSAEDGSMKWRYVIAPAWVGGATSEGTNAASSPVIADGKMYVLTDDGALHCFTSDIADNEPPEVFKLSPAPSTETSGSPPIPFSASLFDLGTGINPASVQIELDKNRLDHEFDMATSVISAETPVTQPVKSLPDGRHTVLVRAADWMGNTTEYEWSFIVNNRLRPRVPPKSKIPTAPASTARPTMRSTPQPTPQPQQRAPFRGQLENSQGNFRGTPGQSTLQRGPQPLPPIQAHEEHHPVNPQVNPESEPPPPPAPEPVEHEEIDVQ